MRTRQEMMAELNEYLDGSSPEAKTALVNLKILETVLDIRDILQELTKKQ